MRDPEPSIPAGPGGEGREDSRLPADALSAIGRFFHASGDLSRAGVIKGPNYTGEIAEWVCSRLFGIDLVPYRERQDFDGTLDGGRVVIRFTNCPYGRPLRVPDPRVPACSYEELIAVLGPRCSIRPEPGRSLLIYRFPADGLTDIMEKGPDGLLAGPGVFKGRKLDAEVVF